VDLYIHSPIRLHGAMLNELSTGTILPLSLHENVSLYAHLEKFKKQVDNLHYLTCPICVILVRTVTCRAIAR
jgi:hypothetical protein